MAQDTTNTAEPTTETETLQNQAEKAGASAASPESPAAKVSRKRKVKRSVPSGQMHVLATFNNTIITFTDSKGGALANSSAGACGFRGSKKGTAYAAQVATERAGTAVKQTFGLNRVDVYVKGIGLGREAAVRSLLNLDIHVDSITDVTGVPHGGVRPKKARRV